MMKKLTLFTLLTASHLFAQEERTSIPDYFKQRPLKIDVAPDVEMVIPQGVNSITDIYHVQKTDVDEYFFSFDVPLGLPGQVRAHMTHLRVNERDYDEEIVALFRAFTIV